MRGFFSTKEKAEEFCKLYADLWVSYNFKIENWDLDPVSPLFAHKALLDRGYLFYQIICNLKTLEICGISQRDTCHLPYASFDIPKTIPKNGICYFGCIARGEDHAKKIAVEKLQEYNATRKLFQKSKRS